MREDWTAVTRPEELDALLGVPTPRVAGKVRRRLDEIDTAWIGGSPLVLVATSGPDGSCDVSPKGDPAGSVLVLDDTTLALPERPGNRRADGFRNVLGNPQVGLLFLVPGRGDTLRVNGRATLVREAPFLDAMTVRGSRPVMALVLDVEEVFFHCSKAFLRSGLWDPETWRPDALPSRARIAQALERPETSLAELEHYYGPAYAQGLY